MSELVERLREMAAQRQYQFTRAPAALREAADAIEALEKERDNTQRQVRNAFWGLARVCDALESWGNKTAANRIGFPKVRNDFDPDNPQPYVDAALPNDFPLFELHGSDPREGNKDACASINMGDLRAIADMIRNLSSTVQAAPNGTSTEAVDAPLAADKGPPT